MEVSLTLWIAVHRMKGIDLKETLWELKLYLEVNLQLYDTSGNYLSAADSQCWLDAIFCINL